MQIAGRRIRPGDGTDDSLASFVAKGYSNAKMRELFQALAAIWQSVNLRVTVVNFHLCPLKWQNLSAVTSTPQSLFLPGLSRVFSIVNTSRYAIFPHMLAKFQWVALRRANPDSLDKSRGSRNYFGARAGFNQTRCRFIAECEKWNTTSPRRDFRQFDSIIILIFSLRLRIFGIGIFYLRLDHRRNGI